MRNAAIGIVFLGIALLTGGMVAQVPPAKMLIYVCALVIITVTFINTEWGLYILIFSMLLSPEFIAGETGRGSLGRGVTLRMEDVLLALIGLSWFAKNAVMKDLGLILKTPLNKPILFYMLVCVLSTGFGLMAGRVDPKTGALFVLKYFEYFIVFFMMVNHVRNGTQLKRFVFCLFLTAFLVSVIAFFQIPGGGRVSAPFEGPAGEPNTFGGYLLFIGMVAAGLAAKVKDRKTRHLLLLLIVCMVPPFFFTQSRSSYMGFIPACMVLGFMTERRLIIVGLLAVGLLLSPLFLPSIVKNRILFTFNQPEVPGQITIGDVRLDTSTSARLQSWKEALGDFNQHPFLGYGVAGYTFVDAQFPRVLTETGLVGVAAFLYLLYSVFKLAFQRLRETSDPYYQGLIMGFLAGFVGLVVHSLGTNTFIIVRIMEPFWFFVGAITVIPMTETQTATARGSGPARHPRPAPRGTPTAFPRLTFRTAPGKEPQRGV